MRAISTFLKHRLSSGRLYSSVSRDEREGKELYKTCPIDLTEPKFEKVLIANRGEIACRIIKTAQAMGIKTVAVHSDVDSSSLHVKMADEAVLIGTARSTDSYLRADSILEAVRQTGAQAVHPGYGFLSENTKFAAELEKDNVIFIGPNSKAILDMGDKIHSKKIAAAAKVNMIPGYDGEIADEDMCVRVSKEIGFPVMIKASAGGGGKGMRIAWNEKEAREGYRLSKQEAASSFGDDRMLVEKFIDNPRHIEMQILCDKHGNGIWLNERECSIQRRNQKVIEEAPSSFVIPSMREKMGEQAIQLAKAVGYDSAGTVEFLVDSQRNFYFLEMNTRLQVEHPITEAITGIDIVQQMLRVAYGHKLPLEQKDVPINGWAFESRVYAEDPYKGFGLPSVGRLPRYVEPRHMDGVRCDSGIREGSEISIYYDPLICKLVTHGKDRHEALNRMTAALDAYVIRGVKNNLPLLRDICEEKRFRSGEITTKYLPEVYPNGFQGARLDGEEEKQLAAMAAALFARKDAQLMVGNARKTREYSYLLELPTSQKRHHVTVHFEKDQSLHVHVNDKKLTIQGELRLTQPTINLLLNDHLAVTTQLVSNSPGRIEITFKGTPFSIRCVPCHYGPRLDYMKPKPTVDLSARLVAPMPGAVVEIAVKEGQSVAEGQVLVVMEAMKMKNSLHAAKTGKVKAVKCTLGKAVDEGDVLVELE